MSAFRNMIHRGLVGLLTLSLATSALAVVPPDAHEHGGPLPDFDVRGIEAMGRPAGPTGAQKRARLALEAELARGAEGTADRTADLGRDAQGGALRALLAARGFSADPDAIDGPWGFMAVHGGGASAEKLSYAHCRDLSRLPRPH